MVQLTQKQLGRFVIAANIVVAFSICEAQQPMVAPSAPTTSVASEVGQQSVDLIELRAYAGGTPLRHGNLIPGSERIVLNGVALVSAVDYAIDYVAGVVYLKVTQNSGDSLVAYYNYGSKPTGVSGLAMNGFQLNLLPGASMIMGMGMTERDPGGQTVSSNVFGLKNNFSFGAKSSLGGLMLVANEQGSGGISQYSQEAAPAVAGGYSQPGGAQSTHFIVQNYKSSVMGGSMSMDLQDVSQNFGNFSAVGQAGYSDADVARFRAEKGLERTGVTFSGLKFGGLSLNNSFKSVQDSGGNGITWRSLSAAQGGLNLAYSSQKVDDNFGRFGDLSESDKAQLLKERGMSRQNLSAQLAQKTGKLSFTDVAISDDVMHQGLHRNDLAFDSARYKADYGTESVDTNFLRASSLTAPEISQYAREVGVSRQWFTFSGAPDAKSKPLTFGELAMKSAVGKFNEKDVAYTGKTWNIQHIDLGASSTFASMAALQDDAVTSYVQKIGLASGGVVPDAKGVVPAAPGDKTAFLASPTLRRDYTSGGFDFDKVWHFKFDQLGLKGVNDSGRVVDASVSNGSLAASFHRQVFGANFAEAAGLMPLEQARLGVLPGLQRQDFNFSDQINKASKFNFTQMVADTAAGGADRTVVGYSNKGFQLDASERKVDTGFTMAGQLVDPEAAILASLAGFRQRDLKMTWNKLPNITFTGEAQDAKDEATGEVRALANYKFAWNLNKTTQFSVTDTANVDRLPNTDILTTETRQISFSKDFGKYGKFAFLDELDLDAGTSSTLPSDHKDYLSYETKLSAMTSFKVEQTETRFSDGSTQGISAETLSQQLTKKMGVSLTEAEITGDSRQPDPAKTNYGVWYDLGNGVRVSYGYAHQYTEGSGSSDSSGLAIGKDSAAPTGVITPPGAPSPAAATTGPPANSALIGPLAFAGGVGTNQYNNLPAGGAAHTQAFNNMAISTVKPFTVGPLSKMKFTLGMNSVNDYNTWSKNNQVADLSGMFGSNSFAFDYKGQLAPQGTEGIDRGFAFQTSQAAKAWLQVGMSYKLRTLPGDVNYLIRDYNFSAKPTKSFEISNQLQTNPEVANGGAFLGSVPQAARSDKWNLAYAQSKDTTFGATYQELVNEASNLRTTTSGLTLKILQKSGSPVSLFYGSEDILGSVSIPHRITNRYSLEFDQHPGPHQTFSMFFGNLSYDFNSPNDVARQNWTVRCDYQLRF
jgi:hypothetical protein